MLGRLQAGAAVQLGLDPFTVVGVAGSAAPFGKMVAPHVLAAAAGAGGIVGSEGRLLRSTLFHSLIWTTVLGLVGWLLTR